jgi:hypothetical protein
MRGKLFPLVVTVELCYENPIIWSAGVRWYLSLIYAELSVNPFLPQGIPMEKQFESWRSLSPLRSWSRANWQRHPETHRLTLQLSADARKIVETVYEAGVLLNPTANQVVTVDEGPEPGVIVFTINGDGGITPQGSLTVSQSAVTLGVAAGPLGDSWEAATA